MSNPALETIREVGLGRLCWKDGCNCLNFSIHHVHVDVSCRKSGGNTHPDGGTTIRVYSHSMDYDGASAEAALHAIGLEVARQMAEMESGDAAADFNIVLEEYK